MHNDLRLQHARRKATRRHNHWSSCSYGYGGHCGCGPRWSRPTGWCDGDEATSHPHGHVPECGLLRTRHRRAIEAGAAADILARYQHRASRPSA